MEQLKNTSTDSRKKSLTETFLDIFLGFLMFLPVNYFVLPLFTGSIADYSLLTAIQIGVMFSTISLIRKFVIRRWFERMRSTEWNGLKNFLKDNLQIKNSAA
jgi:membrane protein CcdC involved in cytochrome C biogenesis